MNRLQPTQSTIKKLFSLSQNQCAFPECSTPLYDTENDLLLGEICHIHSAGPGGERFDPGQSDEERRDISNLILLCANHHLTTNHVKKYTAEVLRKMKEDHKERFFPLPTYELETSKETTVEIYGKILNENYVKILRREDLPLDTVILLDKVQKHREISRRSEIPEK